MSIPHGERAQGILRKNSEFKRVIGKIKHKNFLIVKTHVGRRRKVCLQNQIISAVVAADA